MDWWGSLISQASFPSLPWSWGVNLQSQAKTDVSGYSVAIIRDYYFRKASFSWRPKKKRTSQGLLTHPTNKKSFWIFLTHRDEDFLHAAFRGYDKNKDGKISLEEFQRVMTRRWVWDRWRFLIEHNRDGFQFTLAATCRRSRSRVWWSRPTWMETGQWVLMYICQSVLFSGMLTMKNLWRWCKHKFEKDLLDEVLLNVKWLGSLRLYSVLVSCVKWSCEGKVNIFYFVHCSSVLLRLHQIPVNIMIWSCL